MTDFEFNDVLQGGRAAGLPAAAMAKLQSNILVSAEGVRSTQVFRRFDSQQEMAAWLTEMPLPSSAASRNGSLANVLFTHAGLERLKTGDRPSCKSFNLGARGDTTLKKLGDAAPANWREHKEPWHLIELHCHDASAPQVRPSRDYVVEHGSSIGADGEPLAEPGDSFGHFGIRDGISRHAYTQDDFDKFARKPTDSTTAWDPRRRLSTLLVRDVFAKSADAFGSYFVFRKYEQKLDVFEERLAEAQRAYSASTPGVTREQVKQQIFGRDSQGKTALGRSSYDIDFSDDLNGAACPFHAHIRKMNPRGTTGNLEDERSHSVARRGTSYIGTDIHDGDSVQKRTEKGLLFWCAQANIENQFEHIQTVWANGQGDTSLLPAPDADPLIGQIDPRLLAESTALTPDAATSRWTRWKTTTAVDDTLWKALILRGAEYCYAPSLEGLAALQELARSVLQGGKP